MTDFFVHPRGVCESTHVGPRTRIWAFAHVLPNARIGADCNICDHVFIENDVVVGERVTIKCGVQLWDGVRLDDDVFVGPNVTFTNEAFPRSRNHPAPVLTTHVARGASIGAGATILPNLTIGENAMVGAGAVVTRSVPPNAIVRGNPARIAGYVGDLSVGTGTAALAATNEPNDRYRVTATEIPGATVHHFKGVRDMRGDLVVGHLASEVPFAPERFFMVFNVPSKEIRGEHAHRECAQFLICVAGSCAVVVDDGHARQEIVLDAPGTGVMIPPMIWGSQYKYSADACLLVFASKRYDAADYIRDYDEFRRLVASGASRS